MKNPAVLSLLSHISEQPYWLGREFLRQQSALLRAAGLPSFGRFQPPPLPVAFGPGTAFPEGVVAVPRRSHA